MTPSLPIRSALAVVVLTVAAAVSGCGPAINNNGLGGTTTTNTNIASVRVLNGSLNSGSIDAYLNATTNLPLASGLAYGAVAAVININVEPGLILLIQKPGTTDNTTTDRYSSCALPTLTGGNFYTIVFSGSKSVASGPTALQCDVFNETTAVATGYTTGEFVVKFHEAAPVLASTGTTSVSFGTFVPNPSPSPVTVSATPVPATYNAPIGTSAFVAPTGTSNVAVGIATAIPVPGVTSAPGVGVYVSNVTTAAPTSVLQYVNPVSADYGAALFSGSLDSTNILPYSTSETFGVYLIDGAIGTTVPTIVSAMD